MHSPVLENLLKQNVTGIPVKDFLQQVVTAHPYFAPAHFFLLQQLQQSDDSLKAQAPSTAVMFNNPHWLNFQLQQHTVKETPVVSMYAVKETESAVSKSIEATEVNQHDAVLFVPAENTDNDDDSAVLVSAVNEVADTASATGAKLPMDDAAEINNTDNTSVNENATPDMPAIKIDIAASIKNAEDLNAPAFEPMHLVDYFASQGIKLSEEVQTGDKLGRQLKSFTEWLKTMKKVHVAEGAAGGNEIAVQAMAEKSNAENEVLTEAMAEVFAQQGKAAKAIEVYEKLSLLNTAKSAYFAAKIQNLKGE